MIRKPLPRAALLLLLTLSSCVGGSRNAHPNFRFIELREYGITLLFPASWDLNFDSRRKLQLVAKGTAENGTNVSIEYRGIPQTQEDVDLYAEGWYKAMSSNFDSFEMVDRRKITADAGNAYHFEGTFREGENRLRVIGRLRFREGRVHAIYYIAEDRVFANLREDFEAADQMHSYFRP